MMAARNDDGTGLAALEVFVTVQRGVFAVRNPTGHRISADNHHPIGTKIDFAGIRIAGNNYVARSDVSSAVVSMPLRSWKNTKIDIRSLDDVLSDRAAFYFYRRRRSKCSRQLAPGTDGILDGETAFEKAGAGEATNGVIRVG